MTHVLKEAHVGVVLVCSQRNTVAGIGLCWFFSWNGALQVGVKIQRKCLALTIIDIVILRLLEMSLAEVKSFLSAMSLKYHHRFYLMGRSRMGLTSDWTIYLTGLMVSPGVMPHLGHAALPWSRTGHQSSSLCGFSKPVCLKPHQAKKRQENQICCLFIAMICFAVIFSQVEDIIKATLKSSEVFTEASNWILCCWR